MDRKQRIERYTPLVERAARVLLLRLPPSVSLDELVSAGYLGLIEATDRFDPDRNVDFATFARPRIHGAMLDALRELDLLPRALRHKINTAEDAHRELEQRLGRPPEVAELADYLQIPLEELRETLLFQRQASLIHFDGPDERDQRNNQPIRDRLVDEQTLSGHELLELKEANRHLRDAFDGLPERLRMLLILYYVEELTMQEIAVMMSLTIGRISQLHTQAIAKLREQLEDIPHVDRRQLALLFRASANTDS